MKVAFLLFFGFSQVFQGTHGFLQVLKTKEKFDTSCLPPFDFSELMKTVWDKIVLKGNVETKFLPFCQKLGER